MLALWVSLGVFAGYVTTSVFFHHFPLLLHKKKKHRFTAKHISHRGGAAENIENTMTAFRHARENGTEMLEIDVHLTADSKVVVCHDNTLDRMTGTVGMVTHHNYCDLPIYLETLDVTFAPGEKVTCSNSDRQIPLLRSLFEEFPDVPMNIDLKDNDTELIDKTIDLIREFKREDLVVLGNLNDEVCQYAHRKAPEMALLFSIRRTLHLVLMFYVGILPFVPIKEEFFEMPAPKLVLKNPHAFSGYRWLIRLADWLIIRPALFRHLQKRGIKVYIFVVNAEEDFDYYLNRLHVDGIMTDYPSKLKRFIDQQHGEETEAILKDD